MKWETITTFRVSLGEDAAGHPGDPTGLARVVQGERGANGDENAAIVFG